MNYSADFAIKQAVPRIFLILIKAGSGNVQPGDVNLRSFSVVGEILSEGVWYILLSANHFLCFK